MSLKESLDAEHQEAFAAMQAAMRAAAPEHREAIMRAIVGWVAFVAQNSVRRKAA